MSLTLALPKGRLFLQVQEYLNQRGLELPPLGRELVLTDKNETLRILIVKNSDLPVYVSHGIAGLGICGSDVIYESGGAFFELHEFSFGATRMCLAAKRGNTREEEGPLQRLRVATKFPVFTRNFFNSRGIPVEIIKLNGSVELAPVLGLAPYIVDLVETGSTLEANGLEIVEELENINVKLIANPAYYKIYYKDIDAFVRFLKENS